MCHRFQRKDVKKQTKNIKYSTEPIFRDEKKNRSFNRQTNKATSCTNISRVRKGRQNVRRQNLWPLLPVATDGRKPRAVVEVGGCRRRSDVCSRLPGTTTTTTTLGAPRSLGFRQEAGGGVCGRAPRPAPLSHFAVGPMGEARNPARSLRVLEVRLLTLDHTAMFYCCGCRSLMPATPRSALSLSPRSTPAPDMCVSICCLYLNVFLEG